MRSYKLRRVRDKDGKLVTASIGVPPTISEILPEDMRFIPEFTEEGLIYRPASGKEGKSEPTDVPEWAGDKDKAEEDGEREYDPSPIFD